MSVFKVCTVRFSVIFVTFHWRYITKGFKASGTFVGKLIECWEFQTSGFCLFLILRGKYDKNAHSTSSCLP